MADFLNTVNAVVIGNSISNQPSRGQMADDAARSRARNIQDNFGIKAESFTQFQNEHGGSGALKLFGWAAAGLAVGLVAGSVAIPLIIGAVVGAIAMGHQKSKVRQGYNDYLDVVAAQGRATRDHARGIAQEVEYDNGSGRKSFVADLAPQQAAYQGASR